MDTTIRNLDEQAYRALRARAVLEGRTVGDLVNDAIRSYLGRGFTRQSSLRGRRPKTGSQPNARVSLR